MTTTFGDIDVARTLFDLTNSGAISRNKDFTRIGSGSYRTAFLHHESNIVYKVGNYYANVSEAAMARTLAKRSRCSLPFELVIPRTRTFRMTSRLNGKPNCVVAQEYAQDAVMTRCAAYAKWRNPVPACNCNQPVCYVDVLEQVEEWSMLGDIHEGNVLHTVTDNRYWLIDLAM